MKQFRTLAAAALMASAPAAMAQTDYCGAPGEMVAEDAAMDTAAPLVGTAPYPVPGHDALAVFFAEPAASDGKVHVTLRVDGQSPAPNTVYFVRFNTSDGVERFFAYNPLPVPGNPATGEDPQFYYGHIEVGPASNSIVTDGPTDPASAASGGDITWVFSKDLLAGFAGGEFVDSVIGEVNFVSGPFGIGFYFPVDETPGGTYQFRGNASCAGKSGVLGAGSFNPLLLLGLLLATLGRRAKGFGSQALGATAALLLAAPGAAMAQAAAYCTLPGELVSEDASGDAGAQGAPDPVEAHDVEAVYVAEPGAGKLVLTLKVKTLAPEPVPNSIYYTTFMLNDDVQYFVSFRPYVLPEGVPNQLQFAYGHFETDATGATGGTLVTDGPVEGSFDSDGFISWTLDSTVIPALAASLDMFNIIGEARVIVGSPFAHPAQPPAPAPRIPGGLVVVVDESPAGFYELNRPACAGGKGALLGAGSPPAIMLMLLALAALARRRR